MKKETKRLMALLLSIPLALGSFTGCMSGDGASNSSTGSGESTGGNGNENAGTNAEEEEIFSIVKEAYNATIAYKGAYTRTAITQNGDDEAKMDVISVDPDSNRLYHKNHWGRIEKIYPHEDGFVSYIKEASERYIQHDALYASQRINSYFMLSSAIIVNYSNPAEYARTEIFNFDSLADYESKVSAWIQDSAAVIDSKTTDEDSDWFGYSNASGIVDVSCTATSDGSYSLTHNHTVSVVYSEGEEIATYEADISSPYTEEMFEANTRVLTVKDGKLISFTYDYDGKYIKTMVEDGETSIEEDPYSGNITIEFSYEFDQAGFDAIALETPSEMEQATPSSPTVYDFQKPVKIFVGNSTIEFVAEGYSRENAMKDVLYTVGSTFKTLQKSGMSFNTSTRVSSVEFKFYKDEACTQELNLSMPTQASGETLYYGNYTDVEISEADYNAIETVYVKATLSSDYAFINAINVVAYADDIPDSYMPFDDFDDFGHGYCGIVPAGECNPRSYTQGRVSPITAYYNDVEITGMMEVVGGTVYDIVYRFVIEEEELNFFCDFF